MDDTTTYISNDPFQQVIVVRGLCRGWVRIGYDCEKLRRERENLIANGWRQKVKTDYSIEPVHAASHFVG